MIPVLRQVRLFSKVLQGEGRDLLSTESPSSRSGRQYALQMPRGPRRYPHHSSLASIQSFAVGKPASTQPRHPPSIDSTFIYPIFCKSSATSADRNPPPQYKIIFVAISGTWVSISRSIIPLPMCTAPGKCPFAHSLSSRTSTSKKFSPPCIRRFTSVTFVSFTRVFASLTSFRNCGECFMEILPFLFHPRQSN